MDDLSQLLKVGDVRRGPDHQRRSQDPWHQPVDPAKDQVEQNEAMSKLASDSGSAASGTTNLGALLKAKLNEQK